MSETVRCDNCGKVWVDPDPDEVLTLDKVDDLNVRLDPGSEVPFGECGECGALAYLVQAEAPKPGHPGLRELSDAERQKVREEATESAWQTCLQDKTSCFHMMERFVTTLPLEEQVYLICSEPDRELFTELLGFDPFEPEED